MKNFGKVALPPILILLVYSIVLRLFDKSGEVNIIFEMILIFAQTTICVLIAIVKFIQGHKTEGGQYLLIALLVLIIGFGTCISLFTLKI
jgi:hypothetical protein